MSYHVGGDCDAYCGRCKMDLSATIVAMVDKVPVQVKCNTCHTVRKFRPPKNGPNPFAKKKVAKPKTTRRRTAGEGQRARTERARNLGAAEAETRFDELIKGKDISGARRYLITETFTDGEVVDHKKFGLGVVLEIMGDKKARVLFRVGEKILITQHQR